MYFFVAAYQGTAKKQKTKKKKTGNLYFNKQSFDI